MYIILNIICNNQDLLKKLHLFNIHIHIHLLGNNIVNIIIE